MLTLGYNYKTRREACGFTQAQLGKMAGVSGGTVSRFENDEEIGKLCKDAIIRTLSDYYRNLPKGEQYRVHLISLSMRLKKANREEAREISIKILEVVAHMQWYLQREVKEIFGE